LVFSTAIGLFIQIQIFYIRFNFGFPVGIKMCCF